MGEARNRERSARARTNAALDDDFSEATANALMKTLPPILYAAFVDEMTRRVAAGQDSMRQAHMSVGVEMGVLLSMLRLVWGLLPPNTTLQMLEDNYRALIPDLLRIVCVGPPGALVDDAFANAKTAGGTH